MVQVKISNSSQFGKDLYHEKHSRQNLTMISLLKGERVLKKKRAHLGSLIKKADYSNCTQYTNNITYYSL